MYISSINSYKINPAHKAVNQKYLKQAMELNKKFGPYPPIGRLLQQIDLEAAYGSMPKQDIIDTLNAIKPYAKNALEAIEATIDMVKSWID